MSEPRVDRILKALAAVPGGLTTAQLIMTLDEGFPALQAQRAYGKALGHCTASGLVDATKKRVGAGEAGPRRNIWQITAAGKNRLAELRAAAEKARQSVRVLRAARAMFGSGTAPARRREAASVLRDAGFAFEQIASVFGVHPQTIAADLRGIRRSPPVPDIMMTLAGIVQRIRAAQEAVQAAGQQLGRDAPLSLRREAAAVLRDLGVELKQIGAVFGVPEAVIREQLADCPPGIPVSDPLRVIEDIAAQGRADAAGRWPGKPVVAGLVPG